MRVKDILKRKKKLTFIMFTLPFHDIFIILLYPSMMIKKKNQIIFLMFKAILISHNFFCVFA